jgi:hypothetical protein
VGFDVPIEANTKRELKRDIFLWTAAACVSAKAKKGDGWDAAFLSIPSSVGKGLSADPWLEDPFQRRSRENRRRSAAQPPLDII